MTWHNKVMWTEGMFLQPQHFQQQDRYVGRQLAGRLSCVAPWPWGFFALQVDDAALLQGRIAVNSARGVLPDGLLFSVPGDDPAPPAFEVPADARDQVVVLAVPMARPGVAESDVEAGETAMPPRYRASHVDVADSHAASLREAPLQIGRLNLRLMLARDANEGYTAVGVARIVERRADGRVALDSAYVPPMLHVPAQQVLDGYLREAPLQIGRLNLRLMLARDANEGYTAVGVARIVERRADGRVALDSAYVAPMLQVPAHPVLDGYLREAHGMLHQRGEALAGRMAQPGRAGVGEVADFLLLQVVNRFQPQLAHLQRLPVLHPERLYDLLLGLAGELSTFRESRRPVAYPAYRHDDLAGCFRAVLADLRQSLSMVLEQTAVPIDLQPRKNGVRVAIIADIELQRTASFVLAVNAQMPGDALRARFPTQVKIGPAERLVDLVKLQLPGVTLRALPVAPRQIPFHAGFTYFELDTRGSELWKQLETSGGLAMHIAGDFPGLELEFWAIRG